MIIYFVFIKTSLISNIYQSCPAFNLYIKDKVLTVPASCFKLITKDKTVAYSEQVNKQTLRLDDIRCHKSLSCNCIKFFKWALCYHVRCIQSY